MSNESYCLQVNLLTCNFNFTQLNDPTATNKPVYRIILLLHGDNAASGAVAARR